MLVRHLIQNRTFCLMKSPAFCKSIILVFCLAATFFPLRVVAEGLDTYIAGLGPPSDVEPIAMIRDDRWGVRFTSQEWQGSTWSHSILAIEPTDFSQIPMRDTVLLFVVGTSNIDKYAAFLKTIADESGVLCAVLGNVPNQPLFDGKKEDDLLAYSFEQYRKTGKKSWPVLFPMVGSVVKAIDVLEKQLETRYRAKRVRVVVTGASKRGWTSWLAPLVDKRIVATAPAVFDFLNFPAQVTRARKAYGADSEKLRSYTELGLTDKLAEPRIMTLQKWIDPFHYRERLRLPKLAILGANDPYWVVDSMEIYWKELLGDKMALMLPNVGHGAIETDEAMDQLARFLKLNALRAPMPWMNSNNSDGPEEASTYVTASSAIRRATKWSADSPTQDFRNATWTATELKAVSSDSGVIASMVDIPAKSYRAFFVTIEVDTAVGRMKMSTAPRVVSKIR